MPQILPERREISQCLTALGGENKAKFNSFNRPVKQVNVIIKERYKC